MRGGGGGGTQVQRGAAPVLHIPRFCKRTILFCTQVQSMGGGNPLTIHEIYAALTPSDSRSDWASEFAAAKQAEDYKI